MAINLYSLGAAEEVTGSKHILEVDGESIMVDCGAFQGSRAEADRKNRAPGIEADRIASVLLTHGHFDHCGMLPLLSKKGYRGNIYATPATRDIASLVMMDSAHIQARDAEYLRAQARKRGEHFAWEPLYTEKDAVEVTGQMVGVSYHRPFFAGRSGALGCEFFDAGHILGSAFVTLTAGRRGGGSETTVLFSGDLGRPGKPIIRDPDPPPPADYLVLESTYGDRLHGKTESALEQLAGIVKDAAEKGGKIIIPSFAIERTQELVYYFHLLEDEGIMTDMPIYVDSPMASNATTIFQVHPECYDEEIHNAFIRHHKNPFGFNRLHFVSSVDESKALNSLKGPAVIISADGMCEAGRIQHHLANNIGNPAATVLLVGFMAENTLGRRLQNREEEVKIHGLWHKRRARVENINAFSAHADYGEAISWLKGIDRRRLKKIFLVHGEPKAQGAFKQRLAVEGFADVEIVKYGEVYALD